MIATENTEFTEHSLLTLLTLLTSLNYFNGGNRSLVRGEILKPCWSPSGIVNNMVKKANIMVKKTEYLL